MAKGGARIRPMDLGLEEEVEREYRKGVTYVARVPLLGIKPIKTSDPVLFKKAVEGLKAINPDMNIYTFKVEVE